MSGPWVGCTSGGGPVSASKEYFGDGHQSFRQLAFRRDLAEFLVAAHPKVWRLRDIHVATKLNVPSWAGPRPTRHYVGDQMTRVGPPVVRKGSTYGDRRAGGRGQLLNAGCPSSNASRHCACRSADGRILRRSWNCRAPAAPVMGGRTGLEGSAVPRSCWLSANISGHHYRRQND